MSEGLMKYSRVNHLLFSLILSLFINSANADRVAAEPLDDEGEVVRTLPDGHVHIINTLNTKIYFYLSYDGESWDEVDLDAKQDDIFELANYIKISTKKDAGTQSKQYKLELSRRYQIIWNANDRLYDIVKLSES
jgi:hypothetical protein